MSVEPLAPRSLEKIWGSFNLYPWFADAASPNLPTKIGEVWLEGLIGLPLPLLIKFLFTTERLSVQVHPGDEYAQAHHHSPGKTEMWHILRAEAGAEVALGLNEKLTEKELRAASASGAIEQKLNWIRVHPGDTFLVPAGTIHAIGAGIALCEVQQPSDITYRLYDYGRGRELHLDHGVAVSNRNVYQPTPQPDHCLAECTYFRARRLAFDGADAKLPARSGPSWLVCLEGAGSIDGNPYREGSGWQVNGGSVPASIHPARPSVFLEASVP